MNPAGSLTNASLPHIPTLCGQLAGAGFSSLPAPLFSHEV